MFMGSQADGSVCVVRTNYGAVVVMKGIGPVHHHVSPEYLDDGRAVRTWPHDRLACLRWCKAEGLTVVPQWDLTKFRVRHGRRIHLGRKR